MSESVPSADAKWACAGQHPLTALAAPSAAAAVAKLIAVVVLPFPDVGELITKVCSGASGLIRRILTKVERNDSKKACTLLVLGGTISHILKLPLRRGART